MTEQKPPLWPALWQVMRAADSSCASDFTSPEARAIIAVRDWLVPEEEPPLGPAGKQNMHLRDLLTAEADRAERGD